MPDLDLRQPLPDRAHEGIRQAVVQAIDDLKANTAGIDDSFWLVDVLFGLLDSQMSTLDAQSAEIAALTTRVTALEAPCSPDVAEA